MNPNECCEETVIGSLTEAHSRVYTNDDREICYLQEIEMQQGGEAGFTSPHAFSAGTTTTSARLSYGGSVFFKSTGESTTRRTPPSRASRRAWR